MNILKTTSTDAITTYNLTMSQAIEPLGNIPDNAIVTISDYAIYEKEDYTHSVSKIVSIAVDNTVYATNSATFVTEFENISNIFENPSDLCSYKIQIIRNVSSKGRTFTTCRLVTE